MATFSIYLPVLPSHLRNPTSGVIPVFLKALSLTVDNAKNLKHHRHMSKLRLNPTWASPRLMNLPLALGALSLFAAAFWSNVAIGGEIHEAAAGGDLEKIKALVHSNPDLINSKDTDREPGLYSETPLDLAVAYDRQEIVEFLLANQADVNAIDYDGRTPLHVASDGKVVELLLAKGANINARGKDGETPLHTAARNGHADMVKLLLAKKADFKARDNLGNTPLHDAAEFFHMDIAKLLLASGADVNARNNQGETPLLLTAFSRGHTDMLKLLLSGGADVNAKDNGGETPLHSAAENGSPDATQLLLANGADANATNHQGRTPLSLTSGKSYSPASAKWYQEVAEMLRQHGGHE